MIKPTPEKSRSMRNDISFIVAFEMDLWEHQSTFNPNMPMRFFIMPGW